MSKKRNLRDLPTTSEPAFVSEPATMEIEEPSIVPVDVDITVHVDVEDSTPEDYQPDPVAPVTVQTDEHTCWAVGCLEKAQLQRCFCPEHQLAAEAADRRFAGLSPDGARASDADMQMTVFMMQRTLGG